MTAAIYDNNENLWLWVMGYKIGTDWCLSSGELWYKQYNHRTITTTLSARAAASAANDIAARCNVSCC